MFCNIASTLTGRGSAGSQLPHGFGYRPKLPSIDHVGNPYGAVAALPHLRGAINHDYAGLVFKHLGDRLPGQLVPRRYLTVLRLEARVRIELTIEVLQTSALPLGYRARKLSNKKPAQAAGL